MPRKKPPTFEERGKILAFKETGLSNRAIAKKINRSHSVVDNFIRLKENYNKKKSTGRPEKLSNRDKRIILRNASNSALSVRNIMDESAIDRTKTSVRTVQRFLKKSPNIKRKKMQKKPPLTKRHQQQRLNFAQEKMSWVNEWKSVIFSDEKKFNLDGPDGFSYYFHDLRKEERIFSKRQSGGGSVMIWAAIGYKNKGNIVFLSGKVTSEKYKEVLEGQKDSFLLMGGSKYIFQQDNAPVHTAKKLKEWLKTAKMRTMEWPARSPDLNIIESMWGMLSRLVYKDGKQFNSLSELRESILKCWGEIDQQYVRNLYESLPKRIFDLIKSKGKSIKY